MFIFHQVYGNKKNIKLLAMISQSSAEDSQFKPLTKFTSGNFSSLKYQLPPIEVPLTKRNRVRLQTQQKSSVEMMKPKRQTIIEGVFDQGISLMKKKQKEWIRNSLMPQFIHKNIQYEQMKQLSEITEILKCIYDESEKGTSLISPFNILYRWEASEIQDNIKDTNLGDFIIKFPNPDNLPLDISKQFPQLEEESENVQINLEEALELYDAHFETESDHGLLSLKNEKHAFVVGFYFIDLFYQHKGSTLEKFKEDAKKFEFQFNYFIQISTMDSYEYIKKRKHPQFLQKQSFLSLDIQQIIKEIEQNIQHAEDKQDANAIFGREKQNIYKNLKSRIEKRKQNINDPYIAALFLFTSSISKLFQYFPKFLQSTLREAKKLKRRHTRKLFKGGYLKKVIENNQVRWVIDKKLPSDVSTLLRKFVMYRLSQRGGLFLRSFLSTNEDSIFIVLKTNESILERHAQNSSTKMEIQIGSTDLFSFQPVDSYFRPLRVHKYLRDSQFINQYDLKKQKEDKDQKIGERSIESEAMNFYKKAERMNRDQLRAKVILEQEEADDCYRWVSGKLGISFINAKQVLVNEYNQEEIDEEIWQIYYVYIKFIVEYINRVKQLYKSHQKKQNNLKQLDKNIGMLLRLMFLKALYECNELYYNHREIKGLFTRECSNIFKNRKALRNIWDYLGIQNPKGFWTYLYSQKLQRMWKKFQINENKKRSKFFPANRLIITNSIIRSNINLSKAISKKFILDYFPIHDPYVLKSIKTGPYINVVRNLLKLDKKVKNKKEQDEKLNVDDMFSLYYSPYSKNDFTEDSIEDKLSFKISALTKFSVNSVRYYCGQKIAIFFEFRRFIASEIFPYAIIAFLVQILFWVQIKNIEDYGESVLTPLNNVLTFIFALLNIFWVNRLITKWRKEEEKIAQEFGVEQVTEEEDKRVLFEGQFMREFQTDQMNFQYLPAYKQVGKRVFTYTITTVYIILMALVIVEIFVFKTYLYQSGYDQQIVSIVPSLLISISVQIFTFLYTILIKYLTDFEDHKTITSYESALTLKSYIINFLVTFYALFIYSFFSQYIESDFICLIRTNNGQSIINCYYYVSTQLTTMALVDLLMTVLGALIPFISFKVREYLNRRKVKQQVKFNKNYFESIDQFYEEQDQMDTYMYNDEIDNTWLGYIKLVSIFTALTLFGPALPFLYVILFLTGVIGLHSGKFQIIYFKKRSLPIRAKSINIWLWIIQIISVIGIFVNIAFVIFVRDMFLDQKASVFLFVILFCLILKIALSFASNAHIIQMQERNKEKTLKLIHERGLLSNFNFPEAINTDIENVFYDEKKLFRKFPKFIKAVTRFRDEKKG